MADGNGLTQATYRVTIEGKDVTDKLRPRLSELALTVSRAGHADQVDLSFEATDGRLAMPRTGVTVGVMLGFVGSGVQMQGTFTVDERGHSGTPDMITLTGRSAKLASAINTRKERSFSNTTIGHVVKVIAGENGLTPRVSPALASITVDQIDQTESDIAMLRRLAHQWDAVCTIKAGYLIFGPVGKATTVSGKALPLVTLTRTKGDNHHFHEAKRDAYTGVRAGWHDLDAARGKTALSGEKGHIKVLRGKFSSPAEAKRAAAAEMARIKRGAATFELDLAVGRPDLVPETPVKLQGWDAEICGFEWIVAKATHKLTGTGGYTTHVELENRATADEHPAQDEDDDADEDA